MNRRKIKIRIGALFLFIALSAGLALAEDNGVTFTTWTDTTLPGYSVTTETGALVKVGSLVQLIKGSVAPPDRNNSGFLATGQSLLTSDNTTVGKDNENLGITQAGEFDYYYKVPAGAYYVRVWNSVAPIQGAFYNNQAVSVPNPPAPPVKLNVSFSTTYQADEPFIPFITQFDTTLSWLVQPDTTSGSVKVYSAQPAPGAGQGVREITRQSWEYTEKGTSDKKTAPGDLASKTLSLPDGTLKPGKIYTFRVMHGNSFADKWSDPKDYAYSGTALGGGPLTYPITFEVVTNKSGFNFFAMPMPANTMTGTWFATDVDGNSLGKIETAYDLIKVVNIVAGKNTGKKFISTFGKWDPNQQVDAGIMIPNNDPDGTAKAALIALKLEPNVGYQVYIGKDPATNLWPSSSKTTIIIKNGP
ncbi:hypothetical protein A3K48_04795 [candidate division WOR-1 bacterium RIFOXYA12_FULL_52_29]|uniref:Fibronectin type-III domain-containing protein n=1 Tax=candidate division WOR-1 bacterium RIFOXYC12_FULL_54_18 TaxID=1802584 RepID=A0A1F4T688_UNCSA|nr:MAG: hypothetical protein A3K44_04795 [candidate division WOR-1 bacterium RIFOXYA2_FULL_51_19]OGC17865.1 MAG: hypothetical protein A3K48_04795 [candidate division WOR-1 bacterium RIFOXYA12_FULL_52_29]OGC26722.1 MAG: hypothetical protein A3K32_04790 [candidate division WOR-1 bacterium RIFOXYB2_FULL_45_9]OGC28282.1 MAG: hypothetical protein A3K49_04795 [candidate division WOR-1 bacterium RIFOXYC12_FULL_54_18]OGC31260.1 MAG: hypothetical protein A2346_07825 [candidate division WOR-1 bacterium R